MRSQPGGAGSASAGNVTRGAGRAGSHRGMACGSMAAKRKRGALAAGKAKRARSALSAGEAAPEGGPRDGSIPPQEYSIPPPVSQVLPLGPALRLCEGTRLSRDRGVCSRSFIIAAQVKVDVAVRCFRENTRKALSWSMSVRCVTSVSEVLGRVGQFSSIQRLCGNCACSV